MPLMFDVLICMQNHKLVLYKVVGIWQRLVGNLYSAPHRTKQVRYLGKGA